MTIPSKRLSIADAPTEAVPFSFVVLGDTDAGAAGGRTNPGFAQAFAQQVIEVLGDCRLDCRFLLHTGDVTYPTGSYENYLHGFLQPYRALLQTLPSSPAYSAESIVFNKPLLPVPGNHDYARSVVGMRGAWARLVRGMCDRLRQTLGIDLGHYGGEGGEAYSKTFLDALSPLNASSIRPEDQQSGIHYRPGQFTRLPNRYYCFRYGGVDFFALDSNTWNCSAKDARFDSEQLVWLERELIRSWQMPGTVGRVIYLHHSPYTTEISRWQQPETLWVRRHLRRVFDKVAAAVQNLPQAVVRSETAQSRVVRGQTGRREANQKERPSPIVDIVLSGHAHCLEHVRTNDTGYADAYVDWIVCGGSGADVRAQRKSDTNEILGTVSRQGRQYPGIVAESLFYAGAKRERGRQRHFHSFIRIDVNQKRRHPFRVVPFIVSQVHEAAAGGWQVRQASSFRLGSESMADC